MVLELGIMVTTGQGREKGYGEGKFGVLEIFCCLIWVLITLVCFLSET